MICSNCASDNEAGRKFCKECGARLASGCPTCGALNAADAKFCGECGTQLTIAAAPAAGSAARANQPGVAPAPTAERRVVSVLFADLVGFTSLSEGRDAEDTRELLTRYFDLAQDIVGRYGGTVEKFIGDAVMAVWGAPAAREDDPERAVRAALDLVDSIKALGPTIAARAAVMTGEAAVTLGAVNQGLVAGDLVNTASRLQAVAASATVLVDEKTHRAAARAIVFEEAGDHVLKGKTSPVPAWRALRVVAERGGRNRSDTLEAPFVGRDDELRLLKDLYHATAREQRPRLVSVIGPAGIGKTRLAWEYLKYLDGLVETVWYHSGRSPAYGEGLTFWALGEMVRRRAGLVETDDEPTTRSKIAATLEEHVPDADERRWIEPALLALLGIDSGVGSEQLFGAWRTFFERLAATAPVVMIFEDYHHADAGLIDFVDHLMAWARTAPIYIVTLARPELIEKRPDWGAGKRNFTSLYLEPLTPAAMQQLLDGLVPGLPAPAAKAIVARADGIPLYAVETVRMLLATGRLTLDGEVYRPSGDLSMIDVPDSLTALIASRLDALPPDERAVVADAAVLGQSFTPAALAAVSGSDEVELEPRLRDLVRRELLVLQADPRSPERGQFAFVQALIREVAYHTLARADRKTRHLAAARYFESLGSDELAGALAGHYLAAHANAPEGREADALAGQARLALYGAGERAAALGSHDQALRFFDQAGTVTTEPTDAADALERAGISAAAAGHYGIAEERLREAVERRRAIGDRLALVVAIGALGQAMLDAKRTEVALDILEAGAEEFADLPAEPAVIDLGAQLARAYYFQNDRRSLEVADRVLEAAEHAALPATLAEALVTKGAFLARLGRVVEGLALLSAGQAVAEANGLLRTIGRAQVNRTNYEPDPRTAFEIAKTVLALARRTGERTREVLAINNGSFWSTRLGDWGWVDREATVLLESDLEPIDRANLLEPVMTLAANRGQPTEQGLAEMDALAEGISDPTSTSGTISARGWAAIARGDLAEARAMFAAVATHDPLNAPLAWATGAHLALWERDREGAQAALAGLEAIGLRTPWLDADRVTIRAGLAALDGRTAEAAEGYRDARGRWRTLGLVWDGARCAIDMATVMDPADPEVRAAAADAREVFVRLGAQPYVARVDALMERAQGSSAEARALRPSATQASSIEVGH